MAKNAPGKDGGQNRKAEGRPSKLTPEVRDEIAALLRAGNYVTTVADYMGIHPDTIYEWMRRGERGWKIDHDGGYVEFSVTVKKAMSEVEMATVDEVRKGFTNWQSRAWFLERRYPSKWGAQQKQVISGPNDKPVEIKDVTELPESLRVDRLMKLLAVAEQRQAEGE